MSTQVTVGGISDGTHLVEELELPLLEDYEPMVWIEEAVDLAASNRKGTVVVGPKGVGKSVGVRQAVEAFDSAERAKQDQDATYERRRILSLHAPRDDQYRDVIGRIWKEAAGMKMSYRRGMHGKGQDELLYQLVEKLLSQNVAVVVLDEAERLSEVGLEALRDLISAAETKARERQTHNGDAPGGVGVVLVGTPDVRTRLQRSDEMGHRWLRVFEVQRPSLSDAARYYRQALPCLDAFATQKGDTYWHDYLRTEVLDGQQVAIRFLEHHIRRYVRWVVSQDPSIESIEEIEMDRELFESAADETIPQDNDHRED